jgi:hypothetical protein
MAVLILVDTLPFVLLNRILPPESTLTHVLLRMNAGLMVCIGQSWMVLSLATLDMNARKDSNVMGTRWSNCASIRLHISDCRDVMKGQQVNLPEGNL